MPDGNTITVKAKDGTLWDIPRENLRAALARGVEVVSPEAKQGAYQRTKGGPILNVNERPAAPPSGAVGWLQPRAKGLAESLGMDTKKIAAEPTLLGAEGEGFSELGSGIGKAMLASLKRAGPLAPIDLLVSGIESGVTDAERALNVPWNYPGKGQAPPVELPSGEKEGHLLGDILQLYGMREAAEPAANLTERLSTPVEQARRAIRSGGFGLGRAFEQNAQTQSAEKFSKYREAYQQARENLRSRVQKFNESRNLNPSEGQGTSGRSPAAVSRAKAQFESSTPHGPVYQEVAGRANQIATENLPKTFDSAKAAIDAGWNKLRENLKGPAVNGKEGEVPPVNFSPLYKGIEDAEDNILAGSHEKIALFRDILKEGEESNILNNASVFRGAGSEMRGGGLKINERGKVSLSEIPIKARNQILAGMSPEERAMEMEGANPVSDVPFDEARKTYTALGKKIARSSGDIKRALVHVQNIADKQIKTVTDPKGQTGFYNRLKGEYSQFASDWYDNDGPLKRLMDANNDQARIRLLTGAQGPRTLEAMGRYEKFGADTGMAGRTRALNLAVKRLKATTPKALERPTPEFPERPPDFDVVRARLDELQGKLKAWGSGSPNDVRWLRSAATRRLGAWLLSHPEFREWLAKNP